MFEWYYVGQFGQLGPLSDEQMLELVESGVISRDTYVWRRGMSDWIFAYSVPEFSRALMPSSPPPPPPNESGMRVGPSSAMATQPYGVPNVAVPMFASPSSRLLAGLLQLLPGVGRMYLGYLAIGVLQLILTLVTCGVMILWSWIDGIVILAGGLKYDGYGRELRD